MSDMKAPLAKVRGLGSAKSGSHHWWMQRVTAIANIPLTLWLVVSLVTLKDADHATMTAWVSAPLVAVMLILMVANVTYHLRLGVQVAIEDYVHAPFSKTLAMLALTFASVGLAVLGIFCVLKIALGG